MSTPYKKCATCGAHLDAGEPCDCKVARNITAPERAVTSPERDARGQNDRAITPPPSAYAEKKKAADA